MSRRSAWAPVVALLLAACGGSSDEEAGSGAAYEGATRAPPSSASSSAAPSSSAGTGRGSSTTAQFGPAPLVPAPGQTWADLYPDGDPPVFPLPGSSRALGSPQAAATAFARDMLGMDSAELAVDSQDAERASVTLRGPAASTRLALRRGGTGWEVVRVSAEGLDLSVSGSPTDGGPTGVDRTVDVTGAPGAPAGTTVDVVDLADGRLVLRQPVADPAASGSLTLTLPDPLPQLAAVIFYVPDGPAPPGPTPARRTSAATISPVHVRA